jgi:hypothetical protein
VLLFRQVCWWLLLIAQVPELHHGRCDVQDIEGMPCVVHC